MADKTLDYYDDPLFNYRQFWATRQYEDQAERSALKKLLVLIKSKKIKNLIDIGAGFGRLTPVYTPLFQSCLLVEPSEKLLAEAKKINRRYDNLSFKESYVEKLPVEDNSFDVALMVRVAHHLPDLEKMITEVKRILKPEGYFIMEFANKMHFKNRLEALIKFNFIFFRSHLPENLKTKRNATPFFNYHPNQIKTLLLSHDFKIIKSISVSNFRHPWLKKLIPLKLLLKMENLRQEISLHQNLYLGPSIFVLAKKENK